MSKKRNINWLILPFILTLILLLIYLSLKPATRKISNDSNKNNSKSSASLNPSTVKLTPTPTPTSTPTPTPKPLTFAQMNSLYGPCTNTPVFIYHHIQSKADAIKNKQVSLSTNTDIFEEQLKYLQSKGYQTIDVGTLVNFFNGNSTIPAKSVILTFDDGYSDFYVNVYPLIQKYGFKAVSFIPTGLINNSGYLTWDEINDMNRSGSVYFGNHTWSHYATIKNEEKTRLEINTADIQLSERGLNLLKVFAYPYGSGNSFAQNYLGSINYNLAFTTTYGKILCAKNSLILPRVRMGNLMPGYYGL